MVWDQKIKLTEKDIDILLTGEILIDNIIHKNTDTSSHIIGGSPFNICKNLTKMHINNRFYGAIGNDSYGLEIQRQIKAWNIQAYLNVTDLSTSSVTMDQSISSPLPIFRRSADSSILLTKRLLDEIARTKLFHFTYWPLSKEPGRSTILSLLDKAHANNALIGFDPNYHPLLDDQEQTGLKTIRDIINRVDIIKPSLDDSYRMFGEKSTEEYLELYEKLGAKLTIMTLGKEGMIARYQGHTLRLPSMAKDVIDATGAGDAFWSGFYAGLIFEKSIYQSFVMGLTASSLKMKTIGPEFDVTDFQIHLERKGI
jgi:fructokinase